MDTKIFNLHYLDELGNPIKGYRLKKVRRLVFEDGRNLSHTYVNQNMEYVGRDDNNKGPAYINNPVNHFRIRIR